jgi:hypothetical protein
MYLSQGYLGSDFCSRLKSVSVRVPALCIRDFVLFNVCSNKIPPSAGSSSAANVVYRDVDVFGTKIVFS